MSQSNLSSVFASVLALALAEGAAASVTAARAVKAEDRTKEQKLAIIAADVVSAVTRFDNVTNDRVPQARAPKVVYAPVVGDVVLATIGRNTATSQAKVVEGTVTAIKTPAEGEKGTTQVRVRIFAGSFDEQLVTLYPAQLVKKAAEGEEQEVAEEAAEPVAA